MKMDLRIALNVLYNYPETASSVLTGKHTV